MNYVMSRTEGGVIIHACYGLGCQQAHRLAVGAASDEHFYI